jgi:cytoskeleton protein RodZ
MTKVTRLSFDDDGNSGKRIHLREISGDADAPLETVGQDLRAARLRRGDDLASVSRVLKIRKDHLEALEEDRLDALPGRAYAIGFVRSYADYLGLDTKRCVDRFKAEISGRTEEPVTVHLIDEDEERRRLPQGWKIIAGIVVLLLAYGAYQLAVSANRMLAQPTPPPPQTSETVTVTTPKPPVRVTQSVPQTTGTSAVAPAQTGSNSAVPTQNGTQIPSVVPQSPAPGVSAPPAVSPAQTGTAPVTAAQTPTPQQQVAALPKGQVYGVQNKNPRVILRAHEATKILVLGPKHTVLINRTLKPGDTYQVPNMVGLTLTTPNGGAVEIDLDGAAMGYAGREQQMTESFSLDPQSIVDRYNGQAG